jgi:hypothetical protein
MHFSPVYETLMSSFEGVRRNLMPLAGLEPARRITYEGF